MSEYGGGWVAQALSSSDSVSSLIERVYPRFVPVIFPYISDIFSFIRDFMLQLVTIAQSKRARAGSLAIVD